MSEEPKNEALERLREAGFNIPKVIEFFETNSRREAAREAALARGITEVPLDRDLWMREKMRQILERERQRLVGMTPEELRGEASERNERWQRWPLRPPGEIFLWTEESLRKLIEDPRP